MHTDLHYVCAHLHTLSLCIFTYIVYTNILMYTPCTYTCTQMYTPCTHHAHICTHRCTHMYIVHTMHIYIVHRCTQIYYGERGVRTHDVQIMILLFYQLNYLASELYNDKGISACIPIFVCLCIAPNALTYSAWCVQFAFNLHLIFMYTYILCIHLHLLE